MTGFVSHEGSRIPSKTLQNEQTALTVGEHCLSAALRWDGTSKKLSSSSGPAVPVIPDQSVEIGVLLGSGGFNDVNEVHFKKKKHRIAGEEKIDVLVVKQLHKEALSSARDFRCGAVDLLFEVKILNSLQHNNIITLHGVSCEQQDLEGSYLNGRQYRIYLDRLYGTVDEKFESWRESPRRISKDVVVNRLTTIALPIAEAMEYLHSKRIIFRDLKPSNMGYDDEDTVKLFDFGLARQLRPYWSLSRGVGTRRYMAPEVGLGQVYDLSADVYSFGVFLHECCTLVKPYSDITTKEEHMKKVFRGRCRPRFNRRVHATTIPPTIQKLIKTCWAKSPHSRPNFSNVVNTLRNETIYETKRE